MTYDRFLTASLDKTWFKMTIHGPIVRKIVDIISNATNSIEFRDACQPFIDQGIIPPYLLDFWYVGCRTSKESFNIPFMKQFKNRLEKHRNGTIPKMDVNVIGSENFEDSDDMKNNYPDWTLSQNEANNNENITTYLPKISIQSSAIFHALTTQMAFDQESFESDGKFRLYLSTQPPVNNRDINVNMMNTWSTTNPEKPGMFDYVAGRPGLKGSDTRFNLSEGHRIVMEMKRSEDVADANLRPNLSPFTTMFPVTGTGSGKDRKSGVKTVGDQVGVGLTVETANKLYKIFTVSTISCQLFSKFNYSKKTNFLIPFTWHRGVTST